MDFTQLLEHKRTLREQLASCDLELEIKVTAALQTFTDEGPYTSAEAARLAAMVSATKRIKMDDSLRPVLHKFSVAELNAVFELDNHNEDFSNSLDALLVPTLESLVEMSEEQLLVVEEHANPAEVLQLLGLDPRSCARNSLLTSMENAIQKFKRSAAAAIEEETAKRLKVA